MRRNSKGRFAKGHSTKRRKTRRRRKNGVRATALAAGRAHAAGIKHGKRRKARKSRKAKARKSHSGKRARPVIIIGKSGRYFRPRKSKYFKKPRRVNGKRRHTRRRNGMGGSLMATVKRVFTVQTVTGYLSIGGGIFAGSLLSKMLNTGIVPFTATALPDSVTSAFQNKYVRAGQGLIHILLGTLIASKVKNKYVKDAGLGLAALGGFDLLTQVLSLAGMTGLPTFSGMNVNLLGKTYYHRQGMSGMNVDLRGMTYEGKRHAAMGETRYQDTESDSLADNINDMLS